jgi:hypothetical protein
MTASVENEGVFDHHGLTVRRRVCPGTTTLAVEEFVDGTWRTYKTTDVMANDYAYTDSAEWARFLVDKHRVLAALKRAREQYQGETA